MKTFSDCFFLFYFALWLHNMSTTFFSQLACQRRIGHKLSLLDFISLLLCSGGNTWSCLVPKVSPVWKEQALIFLLCLHLSRHLRILILTKPPSVDSLLFCCQYHTLPDIMYPRWGNKTANKKCLLEGCQTMSKKLCMHMENKQCHLSWYISRQCFDLEKAACFVKRLVKKFGVSSFSFLLKLVKEQHLYPPKESTKDVSSQDQEAMQQFERYVSDRRANFLIQVLPPNCCGSLLHSRLFNAGLMSHLHIQQLLRSPENNPWRHFYMGR